MTMTRESVSASVSDADLFELRHQRSHDDLWPMLARLYGAHPEYARFRAGLDDAMRRAWADRPTTLKKLDIRRDLEPDWFQRPGMVGYVFYIDRFAGDLTGVRAKLDYLADLGVTYIHFMPCLKPRDGDNDGGYSVADYRAINPALGSMADFEETVAAARARGMSVCIDMVLNHTAKEHAWAQAARKGDLDYLEYYLTFSDVTLPQDFEKTAHEVFPAHSPGNFTYYDDMGRWVWTSFNEHQWDLNWANPQVFLEMAEVMLFLANRGVEVLRLDAVAFLWKRMGTRCQSEPECHMILQALRAVTRIVAPALIHLEEAIVGPAEMLPYLGRGEHDGKEGNLAYHNSLMVQVWSALAARDTRMMTHVMGTHFPPVLNNATYANYLRCHDDIGWAVTDEDASAVGLSGPLHRAFLSDFYEGVFPGSFSKGELFQHDPETGDKRISGTCASLAGVERALEAGDPVALDRAIDRVLMGHALIASFGGIPLIYMGDELGMLNDYSYTTNPAHAHDSRWLHRPVMDWDRAAQALSEPASVPGRLHAGLRHITARRAATPEIHARNATEILDTGNRSLFAFARRAPTGPLLCIFNFSEDWKVLPRDWVEGQGAGLFDLLSGAPVGDGNGKVPLPPYARVWLR
ncbi:amylosucrase [Roseicyclus mahoneyensis]|uniref:Amylosucrase n=1 Tax=Roseicyclus mahoneyensis TaxID=164332 RepID=A0A316GJ90_9RHOB|nr:amylosucrase [Roseicyclus mahoneyensis]PWK60604.1 amylosucrase [Roseicyclus mahoneyensis]